jgi:type II secretory pathway pseudopilin PulG
MRASAEGILPTPSALIAVKKKSFTLIEVVVACTLLLLLSTVAITTTYNFIGATANLKAQANSMKNIMALHRVLANAKLNYATDLALLLYPAQAALAALLADPTSSPAQVTAAQSKVTSIQNVITAWNSSAQQGDSQTLIGLLINPVFPGLPSLPLANPGGSYLPTSQIVQVVGGNPVTTTPVTVQITDLTSLLRAYQLTDTGTPTGNPVTTISVGTIMDRANGVRPSMPIIDWKGGTLQEIQY